jgi:4-hydroxybenzoate polyprenyltransferase
MRPVLLSRDTIKLLRIPFSLYLMPVFLLCLSQAEHVDPATAAWSFVIIHFLVYPASNGYNSYVDRDESSIGGLEKPPLPTRELFYITVTLDIAAVIVAALLVNPLFALCILLYVSASRAYSSRVIRLKKYPLAGFFTVVFFQGAFTYYMTHAGITATAMHLDAAGMFILLATSLQIAGAYPLTQIYQHAQDREAGDITLSLLLGIRGTFLFTALMFIACNVFYYLYFDLRNVMKLFIYLQIFFLPVIAYFLWWLRRAFRDPSEASFKNAMGMNLVASACSASCFLFFILLKI